VAGRQALSKLKNCGLAVTARNKADLKGQHKRKQTSKVRTRKSGLQESAQNQADLMGLLAGGF
jgi:hypothetical protein